MKKVNKLRERFQGEYIEVNLDYSEHEESRKKEPTSKILMYMFSQFDSFLFC